MQVDPLHLDVNVIEVKQENVVFDNAQSIEPNFTRATKKDNESPIPKSKGEKESSQNDKSAKHSKEGDMFVSDDEDYRILYQWKSQTDHISKYQEFCDQFHITFLRVNPNLKFALSMFKNKSRKFVLNLINMRTSFLNLTKQLWMLLNQSSQMDMT